MDKELQCNVVCPSTVKSLKLLFWVMYMYIYLLFLQIQAIITHDNIMFTFTMVMYYAFRAGDISHACLINVIQ